MGTALDDNDIVITIPAEALNAAYGNNAPARIRQMDAVLTLNTYDPALLDTNDVYFGMLLVSAENPDITAGVYITLGGRNAINLFTLQGDRESFDSQRIASVTQQNQIELRLRLERDPGSGNITAYIDDALTGTTMALVAPDAGVLPVLFVRQGGVVMGVNRWQITLR